MVRNQATLLKFNIDRDIPHYMTTEGNSSMFSNQNVQQNAGVYRRRVGEFLVSAVNDGLIEVPNEMMLAGMEPDQIASALTARFRPAQSNITVGAYLIEHRGSRTLIDTGARTLMGPTLGKLVANLALLGITTADIDYIALTHLHPDHVGGMLDDEGNAVFPRAEVFLSIAEEAHWLVDEQPADALGVSAQVNGYAPQLRKAYGNRWHAIGEEEVIPGMRRVALPGHTPGHSGYHLSSGDEQLLIWGDLTHVPVIQIAHPEVGTVFDVDIEQGRATRRRILDQVASDGLAIGGMHLEFPGFGHVLRSGQGYEYVQDLWMPDV